MKNQVLTVALAAAVGAAYFYYKKIGGTVSEATQAATNAFWSLFQEGGVEPTDFNINRLHRDFFDENWLILPEVKQVYSDFYPDELAAILNANGQLKIQYRELIK